MQSATNTTEDLVRELYGLGMVQREIARHALTELNSQGFGALAVIHRYQPVRTSDVARRLNVDLSVASRQVTALERAGYASREADPGDARAQLVSLTEAGSTVLSDSHARMVAAFGTVLKGWSGDEVTHLTSLLARLRDDFTRCAEEGTTR